MSATTSTAATGAGPVSASSGCVRSGSARARRSCWVRAAGAGTWSSTGSWAREPARRGDAAEAIGRLLQLLAAIRPSGKVPVSPSRKVPTARLAVLTLRRGRDPSGPHAGAAASCGRTDDALRIPAPRASGRREDPRREGHHRGAHRRGTDRRAIAGARDLGERSTTRRSSGSSWGWIGGGRVHWNAECMNGLEVHVCKVGSRFAALDPPIAQGLELSLTDGHRC